VSNFKTAKKDRETRQARRECFSGEKTIHEEKRTTAVKKKGGSMRSSGKLRAITTFENREGGEEEALHPRTHLRKKEGSSIMKKEGSFSYDCTSFGKLA